jgi:protein-S-isoprenylcysteine O-methyltransferase Ste14
MQLIRRVYALPGRVARPASVRTNLTKTLVQSLTMWAIFLGLAPAVVYRLETRLGWGRYRLRAPGWRWLGLALFLLGWGVAWASAVVLVVAGEGTPLPLDAPRKFVVAGPYRYIRNPMAAGSILQGIAVGLFQRSPLVVLYALLGAGSWHVLARPWEEQDLEHRFGAAYTRYRAAVRCWLPRPTPYHPD